MHISDMHETMQKTTGAHTIGHVYFEHARMYRRRPSNSWYWYCVWLPTYTLSTHVYYIHSLHMFVQVSQVYISCIYLYIALLVFASSNGTSDKRYVKWCGKRLVPVSTWGCRVWNLPGLYWNPSWLPYLIWSSFGQKLLLGCWSFISKRLLDGKKNPSSCNSE